ncbi:hypothetical protein ACA910_014958 [Epithemia clementina (nom. ined.)]
MHVYGSYRPTSTSTTPPASPRTHHKPHPNDDPPQPQLLQQIQQQQRTKRQQQQQRRKKNLFVSIGIIVVGILLRQELASFWLFEHLSWDDDQLFRSLAGEGTTERRREGTIFFRDYDVDDDAKNDQEPQPERPYGGRGRSVRASSSSPLPGFFHNGQVYLVGARLTTSYESTDNSVFVTLLALQGNYIYDQDPGRAEKTQPSSNSNSQQTHPNKNSTSMSSSLIPTYHVVGLYPPPSRTKTKKQRPPPPPSPFETLPQELTSSNNSIRFWIALERTNPIQDEHEEEEEESDNDENNHSPKINRFLLEMPLIPIGSADSMVNRFSPQTWHANITHWVTRSQLVQQATMPTTTMTKIPYHHHRHKHNHSDSAAQQRRQPWLVFRERSIRFHVWIWTIHDDYDDQNTSNSSSFSWDSRVGPNPSLHPPSLSLDIPLSTGVVGGAGPTLWHRPTPAEMQREPWRVPTFLAPPSPSSPMLRSSSTSSTSSSPSSTSAYASTVDGGVTLCVKSYGTRQDYIKREFVKHHMNLGFHHIVLGINILRSKPNNPDNVGREQVVASAERILADYIRNGTVVIMVLDLPGRRFIPGWAEEYLFQTIFNQACLFHSKGRSEYMASWDLDEIWLPPVHADTLQEIIALDGGSGGGGDDDDDDDDPSFASLVNEDNVRGIVESQQKSKLEDGDIIQKNMKNKKMKQGKLCVGMRLTDPSPSLVQDPIWRSSPYAKYMSILDVAQYIGMYHAAHGCLDWCYHAFPSYTVALRRQSHNNDGSKNNNNIIIPMQERQQFLGTDFHKRENKTNHGWSKSLIRTKFAFLGGIHHPGSCYFSNHPEWGYHFVKPGLKPIDHWHLYPPNKNKDATKPASLQCRNFVARGFGYTHHFFSTVAIREDSRALKPGFDVVDEYVSMFAPTVARQLGRDDVLAWYQNATTHQ